MSKMGVFQIPQVSLGLQQKIVITPQLQQAIKLLQLNRVELAEMIQEELLVNPVLEVFEPTVGQEVPEQAPAENANQQESPQAQEAPASTAESSPEATPASSTAEGGPDSLGALEEMLGTREEVVSQEEVLKEIDWDAYFQHAELTTQALPSTSGDFNPDLPSMESRLSLQESLQEHLLAQLRLTKLPTDALKMGLLIIGSLNERGWLVIEGQADNDPLNLLAKEMVAEEPSDGEMLGEDEAFLYWRALGEKALRSIHKMEPMGIGARSLEECLLLQAWQSSDIQDLDLIERLIQDHLKDIESKNYTRIAKTIKISLRELLDSIEVIRHLDPYPSRNFTEQSTAYITPDIYVVKDGDKYKIELNDDGLPRLRINNYYKQLLRQEKGKGHEFIQDKLRNATWLLRSIQQRKRTIYRVTESIVERQRDFLEKGVAHLKPMILRDVADDIEMHESTISRVTTNKYVHTPQGIYELKFFFTSSLQSSEGGDNVSSLSVKEKIKNLIQDEDPKKPLSDQDIVTILGKEGIKIARRTIAKYRGVLNIPSSSKRKRPY